MGRRPIRVFVGSARVLVHNGTCSTIVKDLKAKASALAPDMVITTIERAQGNGFVVNIVYKGKAFVVRIMASGGGRTYYWRLSRAGKGSIDATGTFSSDRALTHVNIGPNTAQEIIDAIIANVNKYP